MKKPLLILTFAQLLYSSIFSQNSAKNSDNISITKSQKIIKFITGNPENPVQIKTFSFREFTCSKFRTIFPLTELYNTIETIDEVNTKIEGDPYANIIPQYEYYNRDGIFFSDERICYFMLPITKIGAKSKVEIKKTIRDPKYLTSIFLIDEYDIEEQEIKLYVPSWMKIEIKEYNFSTYKISKTIEKNGDITIYTYTAHNLPKYNKEENSPGITYFAPHLLILTKSANPYTNEISYFKNLSDLYKWYHSLILENNINEPLIKQLTDQITIGCKTDEEKAQKIYTWVQENIRYIAFEDGIAGFKPEGAHLVLKKKYGDCKGMANLLTEMLRSQKLDARRCWIGTKNILYDYSTPSLAVDNHMICVWLNKGKSIFLDATEKYIGFGEIAERIQGRQTLIENGENFLLDTVPERNYIQNTFKETRKLIIDSTILKGHVIQVWKGENKESFLNSFNSLRSENKEKTIKNYLSQNDQDFEIINLNITNINDFNKDIQLDYDLTWKNNVSVFGSDIYLNLDNRLFFKSQFIDTTSKKLPYVFEFKRNIILEAEITIPKGYKIAELPQNININHQAYSFSGTYQLKGDKLLYTIELILKKTLLKVEYFTQWNNDIKELNRFYDQQIILTPNMK